MAGRYTQHMSTAYTTQYTPMLLDGGVCLCVCVRYFSDISKYSPTAVAITNDSEMCHMRSVRFLLGDRKRERKSRIVIMLYTLVRPLVCPQSQLKMFQTNYALVKYHRISLST